MPSKQAIVRKELTKGNMKGEKGSNSMTMNLPFSTPEITKKIPVARSLRPSLPRR